MDIFILLLLSIYDFFKQKVLRIVRLALTILDICFRSIAKGHLSHFFIPQINLLDDFHPVLLKEVEDKLKKCESDPYSYLLTEVRTIYETLNRPVIRFLTPEIALELFKNLNVRFRS